MWVDMSLTCLCIGQIFPTRDRLVYITGWIYWVKTWLVCVG